MTHLISNASVWNKGLEVSECLKRKSLRSNRTSCYYVFRCSEQYTASLIISTVLQILKPTKTIRSISLMRSRIFLFKMSGPLLNSDKNQMQLINVHGKKVWHTLVLSTVRTLTTHLLLLWLCNELFNQFLPWLWLIPILTFLLRGILVNPTTKVGSSQLSWKK